MIMVAWFPTDTKPALPTDATIVNGVYELDFGPYNTDRLVQSIALLGPAGSSVNVYVNTIFKDTTARGDFNRADYYKGMLLSRGSVLRLVWNVGTGGPVQASVDATDGVDQSYAVTGPNQGLISSNTG